MRRVLMLLAATVSCGLSACQTTQYNGYVTVKKSNQILEKIQAGEWDEGVAAQIAMTVNSRVFQSTNIDIRADPVFMDARKIILQIAVDCQWQLSPQLAGAIQSFANGAVPYGVAGSGLGPAAALAFNGVEAWRYATYGAVSYLLPGGVNGLVTGAYSGASAKGTCVRDFWDDEVQSDQRFAGIHVQVVYAGKAWGGSEPPGPQIEFKDGQWTVRSQEGQTAPK